MTKIVITDIPFGSAYAYRVGDPIEEEAVKQHGWDDYVANRGTKAANGALGLTDAAPESASPPRTRAAKKADAPADGSPEPTPAGPPTADDPADEKN